MALYLQVSRLRLLGDNVHSTQIAFVEFTMVSLRLQMRNYSMLLTYWSLSFYAFLV